MTLECCGNLQQQQQSTTQTPRCGQEETLGERIFGSCMCRAATFSLTPQLRRAEGRQTTDFGRHYTVPPSAHKTSSILWHCLLDYSAKSFVVQAGKARLWAGSITGLPEMAYSTQCFGSLPRCFYFKHPQHYWQMMPLLCEVAMSARCFQTFHPCSYSLPILLVY